MKKISAIVRDVTNGSKGSRLFEWEAGNSDEKTIAPRRTNEEMVKIYRQATTASAKKIEELAEQMCELYKEDPGYYGGEIMAAFANDISKAPIGKLVDAIIEVERDMSYFAASVKGAQTDKMLNAAIASGDAETCVVLAREMKGAPINKLLDVVLAGGDAWACIHFARDVKGAPIDKMLDMVIESGDAYACYLWACDVKGAPIERLADLVIASEDAGACYLFARYVKDAPIGKLADAVIATGDLEVMAKFVKNIENAPLDKFAEAFGTTVDELKAKIANGDIDQK